jgi:hypothetical protein
MDSEVCIYNMVAPSSSHKVNLSGSSGESFDLERKLGCLVRALHTENALSNRDRRTTQAESR